MNLSNKIARNTLEITAVAIALTATPVFAQAQTGEQQEPPAINPAAEQAVKKHFQAIYAALEGKAALPDAKNFTDDFNQQTSSEQIRQVFSQVRKSVGSCRIAAQTRIPISYVASYLLECDKAFLPIEIAVEEKAPYRIQGLLIRPSFQKL